MLPEKDEHQLLRELILENQKILTENNQLLKKVKRHIIWSFWIKVVGFTVFIGAPFILYYYVLGPYFETVGSSFQAFQQGLQEVPGWKQFYEAIKVLD